MTNIALTTLILIILAFPGYLFLAFYHSREFTTNILPSNWTDHIAKAIMYSIPFYFIEVLLFKCLQHYDIIHYTLRFEIVARVLTLEFGDSSMFAMIVDSLHANWLYITLGYGLVVTLAIGTGLMAKKLVWKYELDVKFPFLRYESKWLYRLMGRGQLANVSQDDILVRVDALTNLPTEIQGKNRLYQGIVAGFTTNADGDLNELILTAARWGKFKRNWKRGIDFTWGPAIPGNYFYLKYDEVKNLNITYIQLLSDSDCPG